MDALITLTIYLAPFLAIGVLATRWMKKKNVDLSDVQAQGGARKSRSIFLLGIWRREDRD